MGNRDFTFYKYCRAYRSETVLKVKDNNYV